MASCERILVHLKKSGTNNAPAVAKFTKCILNYFREETTELTTKVCAELTDNKLIISDDLTKSSIKIKHPPFCPFHHLSSSELEQLPDDVRTRGVDVGAAVILETSDNKILLTRRAQNLRTFPGVWVPPGGHIEQNETLIEAGLRELYEETGLEIAPSHCVGKSLHPIALWESVFPPKLSLGQPKRHHVVIYLHGKLTSGLTSDWLDQKLKLCPDEVGACAWFDRKSIEAIVSASEEQSVKTEKTQHNDIPEKFRGHIINVKRQQEECDLPFAPLLNVSGDNVDCERVSTGTKFALEEWLQKISDIC